MEQKKIKKLTLKTEVISRINDNQMNRIVGAGNFCPTGIPWTLEPGCTLGADCKTPPTNDGACGTWDPDCNNTCGSAYTCNGK